MNEINPEFKSSEDIELSSDPDVAMSQVSEHIENKLKEKFGDKVPLRDEIINHVANVLEDIPLKDPLQITHEIIDEESGEVEFTITGDAEWIETMRPIVEKCNAEQTNPGGPLAIKCGCLCPQVDNAHGAGSGYRDDNGQDVFWINKECPLHGSSKEES